MTPKGHPPPSSRQRLDSAKSRAAHDSEEPCATPRLREPSDLPVAPKGLRPTDTAGPDSARASEESQVEPIPPVSLRSLDPAQASEES
jgi:hypothetical protein